MARFLKNRQKSVGRAPGSLVFIGDQKMEAVRIRLISYNKEELLESEVEALENLQVPGPGHISWINVDGIHDSEIIRDIQEKFTISSMVMEDVMNTDHRPGITPDDAHIVVILKAFYWDEKKTIYDSEQISFILGTHYLITFQEKEGDHFEAVRNRLRGSSGMIRTRGADYLMYALMDSLADSYMGIIEKIGDEIEKMEDEVLDSNDKAVMDTIYLHKTELRFLRKNIRPVREITGFLSKTESGLVKKETRIFLQDLEDLSIQVVEAIELYFSMVSDQLNIFHTNVSNRANDVMKVLTIFATIFIPLTFITGVYGTNFDFIPELKWKYGYFMMWGVMLIVAVIMLIFFRKRKWF